MSYITNVIKKTLENVNFRTVLFTGAKSQLVVMNIPVGGEIGEETHSHVEQTLFFQSGKAQAELDGKVTDVGAGDVVVVTPGTKHNVINTGAEALLLYTVYAPANHIDGVVHATKAAADADSADEAFGESVR
jgi:mannose-6-phosphate isomerase-like protein (cupin superfamily)